jgi:hypothetical protein
LRDNRIEKKKVEMNYRNYEGKIVEKYGVELKGWPNSKPGICNPAALGGRPQLEKLLAALESGDCHWVVLTDDELDERKEKNQEREKHGEQVYLPRKSANRPSNPKGHKSAETISDSDDDDEEGEKTTNKRAHTGSDSDERPTKRNRIGDSSDSDGESSDNDSSSDGVSDSGNGDGEQDGDSGDGDGEQDGDDD